MTLRTVAVAATVLATGALTAGCSAGRSSATFRDSAVPAGAFQLVAFNSCNDALGKLKRAAKEYVGPWGFGGDGRATALDSAGGAPGFRGGADAPAAPEAAQKAAPDSGGGDPDFSGTNTHEVGVDEPDLVKTDGRRILTISQGVLRVIDARSRQLAGRLDLGKDTQDPVRWSEADLLLHGNRALVLIKGHYGGFRGVLEPDVIDEPATKPTSPDRLVGPRLLLVDLSGDAPTVTGTYSIDGELVDARQVAATARVVVRSGPRLPFAYLERATDAQRLAANKAVIDAAGPDEWLPRYEVTAGGRSTKGRVSCEAVSRPATYSGTAMVTVLSFDLGKSTLASGDPVTVVADGNTVYSNGDSLYVANDQRWRGVVLDGPQPGAVPEQQTELYKFDTSGPGRPRYVAAGSVPGWLINQYAMSEWDGHLRVATTTGGRQRSESAVYILKPKGKQLVETGKVTGLGKGERIYAVRFVATVGYVVTFRQTDPLYTVDLRNPAAPRVTGELKITGYSAYLHPAGGTRLLGIGQEASAQGRIRGTQVSLFDVADLTKPNRLAQYFVKYGHSEAEFDPHAFLYWPKTGLLVVPLSLRKGAQPGGEALVLRVTGNDLTEVGSVEHPWTNDGRGQIRRSLVIDDVLWTVSAGGAKASGADRLNTLAWIPF